MRLASIRRVDITRESLQKLDEILQKNEALPKESLYLAVLKSKTYKPGRSENTWPLNTAEDDDDVMIGKFLPFLSKSSINSNFISFYRSIQSMTSTVYQLPKNQ